MTTLQSGSGSGGVWISISELAQRKSVSRQSAKERVDRLVKQGLIETRADGRKRLVDLAAYDRAIGQVGDAIREQGAETRRDVEADNKPSALRDAQTERAQYDARLRQLELAEALGKVVPIKGSRGVENAMVRAGAAIVRSYDLVFQIMADIEAAAKAGTPQLRRELKNLVYEQRKLAGDALKLLADEGAEDEATGPHEIELIED